MLGVILPVAGALLGALGSSGGSSTTTTNSVPPEFSPLASWIAQRGQQIGQMPFQPLPFNPVAGFSPYQFAGFDQIASTAMQPSGILSGGNQLVADTLSGRYLDNNPYIDNIVNRTLGDLQGRFASGAIGGGSFGSGGATQEAARGMADAANRLRFQNYGFERGMQQQALGAAPSIYGLQYAPGQQLLGIGSTVQQQAQNQLNAAQQEFMRAQQWPFQTFQAALGPFGTNIGGQSTTTQGGGNWASGLLGGALAGGQLSRLFSKTPQLGLDYGLLSGG